MMNSASHTVSLNKSLKQNNSKNAIHGVSNELKVLEY